MNDFRLFRNGIQINGSVYWMLSHQRQAAALMADWFSTAGLDVRD